MAKDDYFVVVYKILAYLYCQLKAGEDIDPKVISAGSKMLNINDRYWAYIIENLLKDGYIRNAVVAKTMGNDTIVVDVDNCEITPAGIGYLCDNSLMEKAKEFLKDLKSITPFV